MDFYAMGGKGMDFIMGSERKITRLSVRVGNAQLQ